MRYLKTGKKVRVALVTGTVGKASLRNITSCAGVLAGIMVLVVLMAVLLASVGCAGAITNLANASSSIGMDSYNNAVGDNLSSLSLSHQELVSSCPPAHVRITYPENGTRVGNITKVTGDTSGPGNTSVSFTPNIYVDGIFRGTAKGRAISFKHDSTWCWEGYWWLHDVKLSKGYHTITTVARFAPLVDSVIVECVPPKEIHVNASFEDDPANHRWNTIQEGVEDAVKGVKNCIGGTFVDVRDIILVDAGTYDESVIVDRPVILKSTKAGTSVVDGGGSDSAISIIADNCVVEGFKVAGGGINEEDVGIKVTSNNNVIRNNIASGNKYGILLINASNNLLSKNNVSGNCVGIKLNLSNDNTVTNNVALTNSAYGIVLLDSSENKLLHNTASSNNGGVVLFSSDSNTLFNNSVSNNLIGIGLNSSTSNTFSHNTVSSNNEGVCLCDSHKNRIYDSNHFDFNEASGLKLDNSGRNTIDTNVISNNPIGVELKSSNSNMVSVNEISSNNDYGILLRDSSDNNTIRDNTISENGCGVCLNSSNNRVYFNNFIDNTDTALDNAGANSWNKMYPFGNYWSDYHGVDDYCGVNQDQPGSDGIGDAPYSIHGNVGAEDDYPYMDANGWLISPFLVTPSKIDADAKQHQCIARIITVTNRGNRTIQVLGIEPDVNWTCVHIPPLFLNSLESESSVNFIVSGDTKDLSEGPHKAILGIKTDSGTENVSINLGVESWKPVVEMDPKIVINGMLCGQKSLIELILVNPTDESLFVDVSSDSQWIGIEESRSEIKPHSAKQIEVTLCGAAQGAHIGHILVNAKNEVWRIPVGIFVSDKSSVIESCCGRMDVAEFGGISSSVKVERHPFSVPSGLDQLVFAHTKYGGYGKCEFRLYNSDRKRVYSSRMSGHTTIDSPTAGTWVVEVEHVSGCPIEYTLRVCGHVTSYVGTIPVIISGNLQYSYENQSYEFSIPSGLKRLVLEHTGNKYYLYNPDGDSIYSGNGDTVVDNPKAGIWKIVFEQTQGSGYETEIYGYKRTISYAGSIPFIVDGNLKMKGEEQEYEFLAPSGLNQLVFSHTGDDYISCLYDPAGNCIYSGSQYTTIDNPKAGIWKVVVEKTSHYSGSYEVKVYGRAISYLESIPIIISGNLQYKYENQSYEFSVPACLNQLVFRHDAGDHYEDLSFHLYNPDGEFVYSSYRDGYGRINEPKAGIWKVIVYADKGRDSYEIKIYGHTPSYVGSIPVIISGKPQKIGENQSYEFSVPPDLNQLILRHTGNYNEHRFYLYDPDGTYIYSGSGSSYNVVDYPRNGTWKIIVLAWRSLSYEIEAYGRTIQYVESIPAIISGKLSVGENRSYDFSVPSGLDQLVFDYSTKGYHDYKFYLYNPDGECMYSGYRRSITIDDPQTGVWKTIVKKTSSEPFSYKVEVYPPDNLLKLTLTPAYWDVGELQEAGTKSKDFTIKNTGDNTIKIEDIATDASWIELKGNFNKNLLPDDTMSFTVNVSSRNLSAGRYEELVTIKTDNGCYIALVTVEVRRPKTEIAQDSLEISLTPIYWDAGKLQGDEIKSQDFTIKNTGEASTSIMDVTTAMSWVEITGAFNKNLSSGETMLFTVNVSSRNLSAGIYEDLIAIETDHGKYISQVSMEVGRPKVEIMPPSINIAPIHRNETLYFTFNIVNAGNSDLTIDNVSSTDDWITIEELSKNTISPGGIYKLTIGVFHSELGGHSGLITIDTNAGEYQIPVFVVIERMMPIEENKPPIASFTYSPEKPVVNGMVIFNASSSYDTDGAISSHKWNFGDRNITDTTEPIIPHSYALAGKYIVNLTVTDNEGATDSTSRVITITLRGDLNGDDVITSADAVIALQLATSGGWDADADVNGDGQITALDALMILQTTAGAVSQ